MKDYQVAVAITLLAMYGAFDAIKWLNVKLAQEHYEVLHLQWRSGLILLNQLAKCSQEVWRSK